MPVLLIVVLAIVVLLVLGWLIVGLVFKLLWWALIGLVIGALARLVLPGRQAIGWLWTIGAGVAGALLGGIVADAIGVGNIIQFLISIIVAAALIAVLGATRVASR